MNKVIGILAHVDAGKTTLSEQLLCHAGVLRSAGRVDHGDAFLDAHPLERQRGITIFSDQAVFERSGDRIFWVDTPGHADFAAEMERAVGILDCAVLVVSAAEGIQSHTEAIWALLERRRVPTVFFLNKTDRVGSDADGVLAELKRRFSADIVDACGWTGGSLPEELAEAVAERDEALFARWSEGSLDAEAGRDGLRKLLRERALFPAWRGSALNDAGVLEFLDGLCAAVSPAPPEDAPFRARVYKVRHVGQGARLCFFKVLSGGVAARETVQTPAGPAKLNELRLYSGTRFQTLLRAEAGMLCCAPGLPGARPGDLLTLPGGSADLPGEPRTEPMMAASASWPASAPAGRALAALKELEDEDPTLAVSVNEVNGSVDLRVMGPIQLEVLRQLMADRYGIDITFGPLRVLYLETIAAPAIGIGHYEPLRHYAEVVLRLAPGPRGSGVTFVSRCHVDELTLNWQRLIETHVFEKTHKGVLTGAPLTDVRVELLHGRAHPKHTEGGDFREATYRAIRNALMFAPGVLLEPICRFSLRAPQDSYGRILGDLNRMRAETEPPAQDGDSFTLSGEAAYAEFSGYNTDFLAATHGRGALSCRLDHYAPCRDAEAIIEAACYNPLADDTPDSVFCSHGAGHVVPWDEVRAHAHCTVED